VRFVEGWPGSGKSVACVKRNTENWETQLVLRGQVGERRPKEGDPKTSWESDQLNSIRERRAVTREGADVDTKQQRKH